MRFENLHDLFVEQLQDLYSAERQIVEELPKLAKAASHDELRKAFEHHLEETRAHVERLDEVFGELGITYDGTTCEGMQGLLAEGGEIVGAEGDPAAKDAALIAAAQRVEHYEIAAYGTVRTLAGELGRDEAKDLLDQTLDEESNADELLTKIATGGMLRSGVNAEANES